MFGNGFIGFWRPSYPSQRVAFLMHMKLTVSMPEMFTHLILSDRQVHYNLISSQPPPPTKPNYCRPRPDWSWSNLISVYTVRHSICIFWTLYCKKTLFLLRFLEQLHQFFRHPFYSLTVFEPRRSKNCNMSHITRKPVFGVYDQVRLKLACSAPETKLCLISVCTW